MITLTDEQALQIEDALANTAEFSAAEQFAREQKAIATIRAARAQEQAEQEPVAWVWLNEWLNDGYPEDCFSRVNHQNKTPLYAAPVRTKDLTDDEILQCGGMDGADDWAFKFARAVIAKFKEKNK